MKPYSLLLTVFFFFFFFFFLFSSPLGAHKINNAVGQALLAKRLGKKRIIAETGAGQHGVATASVCAKFGLDCTIYMGAVDCERQQLNVFRMNTLGAKVVPVEAGQKTLKDAINEVSFLSYPLLCIRSYGDPFIVSRDYKSSSLISPAYSMP